MRWLTADGVVAAVGIGAAMARGAGWQGVAVLTAFFVSGSVLTGLAERRPPRRTARQVVANGGVAAAGALLGSWAVAAGALAAATADTWATEIGAFSPVPPRLITTGARVARGTSGGITAFGTVGAAAGAVFIAGLAAALAPGAASPGSAGRLFALVAVAGLAGALADSVLGATLQAAYRCPACDARFERGDAVCHAPARLARGWRWLDNDAVNLAATLCGAAVAGLGARL